MARLYFAYGSNLSREQMAQRCPKSKPLRTAKLSGHRLDFVGRSGRWGYGGVATIMPCGGSYVLGAVYQLTADCWKKLDGFEGCGFSYDRKTVRLDDGTLVDTYVASGHRKEGKHPPHQSYKDRIMQGLKDWRLSTRFISNIRPLHDATDYVFVYGTLKRGQGNHGLLKGSYESVTEGTVHGYLSYGWKDDEIAASDPAALYEYNPKYGIATLHHEGTSKVVGELYKLKEGKGKTGKTETLKRLDGLEGIHGGGSLQGWNYQRQLVPVKVGSKIIWAWSYTKTTRKHVTYSYSGGLSSFGGSRQTLRSRDRRGFGDDVIVRQAGNYSPLFDDISDDWEYERWWNSRGYKHASAFDVDSYERDRDIPRQDIIDIDRASYDDFNFGPSGKGDDTPFELPQGRLGKVLTSCTLCDEWMYCNEEGLCAECADYIESNFTCDECGEDVTKKGQELNDGVCEDCWAEAMEWEGEIEAAQREVEQRQRPRQPLCVGCGVIQVFSKGETCYDCHQRLYRPKEKRFTVPDEVYNRIWR